jgi:cell division septum initiation protein DivIVA
MIRLQIQSDSQESALDIIRSAIVAETSRLELGMRATERHIRVFEDRYRVASEDFLRDFAAEDLADGDREYVCWAGELKLRERIASQLETLKGIQYAS